jgi:hypothetical protein
VRRRWLIFAVIGICFGIADWYFLDLLAALSQSQALNENLQMASASIRGLITMFLIISNLGVWLIPVIPIAIYEMKCSQSLWRAALSAVLVWSAALFSYYAYYAFRLMFVGLPNLDFMLYSNHSSASYWVDWLLPFRQIILDQFVEWIGIALIGGAIVGTLSAYAFQLYSKRRNAKKVALLN